MVYDLRPAPLDSLLGPLVRAEDQIARLDERARKSDVRDGFVERGHFHDAVAAMWLEGELVHVEDLVLHDAMMDIRTPTHELTRAHAVLRARRRIFSQPPDWALSQAGLAALIARESAGGAVRGETSAVPASTPESLRVETGLADGDQTPDALTLQLAEIDAVLARSQRLLDGVANADAWRNPEDDEPSGVERAGGRQWMTARPDRNPLIVDADWDEAQRIDDWLGLVEGLRGDDGTSPLLRAALAWDAWEQIAPLQQQAWLGNLLVAALLRGEGKAASHLVGLNVGLRVVPRERRRSRDQATRLVAFLEAATAAATAGLKELDRLVMARTQMERRLKNRRSNSSLPALIELVLARPMVSAGLVARELKITQRAALTLVAELGIREMTGRGRYRAWGIV